MQILNKNFINFLLKKRNGSALVGVISFSILVSIIGLGFFSVMSHMVDSEVKALSRTKAHYAAESGAILGIRFIRQLDKWPENNQSSIIIFSNKEINNFNVDVMYNVYDNGLVRVVSEAYSEKEERGKRVIYDITRDVDNINQINVEFKDYHEVYTINNPDN
jgi:hypothetical protein